MPISIPAGVTVNYDEASHVCTVKGPKGELSQWIDPSIKFNNADGQISFEIDENSPVNIKQKQAFHGLYRSLVNNMVVGVSAGYTKVLELVGVGSPTQQLEAPPPGRRSVPASNPWVPATAGLLMGSKVVRDLIAQKEA